MPAGIDNLGGGREVGHERAFATPAKDRVGA